MVAEVILNSSARATDRIYHYAIPDGWQITVGMRVVVPFGRGNRTMEGYVLQTRKTSDQAVLKPIAKIIDSNPLFDETMVALIKFMRHRYFCTYAEAVKTVIPAGVTMKFRQYVTLNDLSEEALQSAVRHSLVGEQLVAVLKENHTMELEMLREKLGKKSLMATIRSLEKKGVLTVSQKAAEKMSDTKQTVIFLTVEREEAYRIIEQIEARAPAQARILETLCENESVPLSELLELCQTTRSTVKALYQKHLLDYDEVVTVRRVVDGLAEEEPVNVRLTAQQQDIIETVQKDIGRTVTYLLHGVTGSGKTEIYLHLMESCISQGKQAIFLVPEIALTPQMVRQVTARFGERVAVLHSSLTVRERYDEWKRIKRGEVDVAVGARSAVFAPFDNLGLIIMDEEHESTYKSESSPRYHAREIARFRSKHEQSVLLLASATPAIESYYLAMNGTYNLLTLQTRVGNAELPEIIVSDMRLELEQGNRSIFSRKLQREIQETIACKQQTILFLNRRGYSSFVSCRSCGFVAQCPNCNISLTYHRVNHYLVCHYCDYKTDMLQYCPKCGSPYIKHFGIGTQRVVDELERLFPNARVVRMDADTTAGRQSHEQILHAFRTGQADILVGTQMVTKGLDFEKVTLVGVLAADLSLYLDDFRAEEKTFDLITQVCGRAGRGKYPGKAVIQTYDPDHEAIRLSRQGDYRAFYEREIATRMQLCYPPFCEMVNLTFSAQSEKTAQDAAVQFHDALCRLVQKTEHKAYFQVYKAVPAPMMKVNGQYRYRFFIKMGYSRRIYELIHHLLDEWYRKKQPAAVSIDVNPLNLY